MKGPIARGTVRTSFVLGLRVLVQAGTLLLIARTLRPDRFGAFAGAPASAIATLQQQAADTRRSRSDDLAFLIRRTCIPDWTNT